MCPLFMERIAASKQKGRWQIEHDFIVTDLLRGKNSAIETR